MTGREELDGKRSSVDLVAYRRKSACRTTYDNIECGTFQVFLPVFVKFAKKLQKMMKNEKFASNDKLTSSLISV